MQALVRRSGFRKQLFLSIARTRCRSATHTSHIESSRSRIYIFSLVRALLISLLGLRHRHQRGLENESSDLL